MLRTHTCGELRKSDTGTLVTLCGWVDSYRDHGGLVFIDLRDRYGLTQIIFEPDQGAEMLALAQTLRGEDVVQLTGMVVPRPATMVNPKLSTGEIDIRAQTLVLLNKSRTPPFLPTGPELPNEELRLRYRFLDLRRPSLQESIIFRHRLTTEIRNFFNNQQFLEIETPILGRSTPEGARDYLVPSRVHPGNFYALPQSPQLYKQILMVSGLDRYYQIARCFRDEDLRADRQPEFTQVDIEMSFVEQDDVLRTIDHLIAHLMKEIRGVEWPLPLPRMSYREAMEKYGSDKPDLRFGMELTDLGEIASQSAFGVFKGTIDAGGRVRGICAPQAAAKYSRKLIDELTTFVADFGAKGLAFFRVTETGLDSPIAKFFTPEQQQAIISKFSATSGDLIFCVAAEFKVTCAALNALRNRLARELKLFDPSQMHFSWVLDFPLFQWSEEEQRYVAEHHPFCNPVPADLGYFETDPLKIRATSYDFVINGYEAASGSVRIHDPAVQQKVFDLLGIQVEEAEKRFGFLLDALRYGAPPHAGIALGLDRWVMLFLGNDNIRDVIAFPKTQKASDLMTGAPGAVDAKQLRELSLKTEGGPRPGTPAPG